MCQSYYDAETALTSVFTAEILPQWHICVRRDMRRRSMWNDHEITFLDYFLFDSSLEDSFQTAYIVIEFFIHSDSGSRLIS